MKFVLTTYFCQFMIQHSKYHPQWVCKLEQERLQELISTIANIDPLVSHDAPHSNFSQYPVGTFKIIQSSSDELLSMLQFPHIQEFLQQDIFSLRASNNANNARRWSSIPEQHNAITLAILSGSELLFNLLYPFVPNWGNLILPKFSPDQITILTLSEWCFNNTPGLPYTFERYGNDEEIHVVGVVEARDWHKKAFTLWEQSQLLASTEPTTAARKRPRM